MTAGALADAVAVIGIPVALVAVAMVGWRVGGEGPVSLPVRRRIGVLIGLAVLPALVVGSAGVFAVFLALNLTIGWSEFVPFSWYGMFSGISDTRTVVYLALPDGSRVRPETFSSVRAHEVTKHFAAARRTVRRRQPELDADQTDRVAAHFVRATLLANRSLAKPPPPSGLRIMHARITLEAGEATAHERELCLLEEDER